MDVMETLKLIQETYIAGLRAQAKAQMIERLTGRTFYGGSNPTLIQRADPVQDSSIETPVCKEAICIMVQ